MMLLPLLGGALELAVFILLVIRARRMWRVWRVARASGAVLHDALDSALAASGLPARVSALLATELTIVIHAITGWRTPRASDARFTVHRINGWFVYLGVLVFLLVVESVVMHLLLAALWSTTAAWIASALAAYSVLWLVGDAHALRHGGVTLAADALELRIGVRWRGRIAWSAIDSVDGDADASDETLDASILGGNVALRLRAPCELRRVLGAKRSGRIIALSIDDPIRFIAAVTARIPADVNCEREIVGCVRKPHATGCRIG